MAYTMFHVLGSVALGGAIGGIGNAILLGPMTTPASRNTTFDPGFLGNVFIGIVAGLIAWSPNIAGLAGKPITDGELIGSGISAMLIGVSGAKWLTSLADDRKLSADNDKLKQALVAVTTRSANPQAADQINTAKSTDQIVGIVEGMS